MGVGRERSNVDRMIEVMVGVRVDSGGRECPEVNGGGDGVRWDGCIGEGRGKC